MTVGYAAAVADVPVAADLGGQRTDGDVKIVIAGSVDADAGGIPRVDVAA